MLSLLLHSIHAFFRSRTELVIENFALRQQLAVLKAKRPRPSLSPLDRAFWVALRRFWPRWSTALILVTPDTVIRWLCLVNNRPRLDQRLTQGCRPGWRRDFQLEIRAEDSETSPPCSVFLFSSSLSVPAPSGQYAGVAAIWCWRTSRCGSK